MTRQPLSKWTGIRQRIRSRRRLKRAAIITSVGALIIAFDAVARSEPLFAPIIIYSWFTGILFYGGFVVYLYLEAFALNGRLVRELRDLNLSDDGDAFSTLVELLECRSLRVKKIAFDHLYDLLSTSPQEMETVVPPEVCREFAELLTYGPPTHSAYFKPPSRLDRLKTLGILRILEKYGGEETISDLQFAAEKMDPSDAEVSEAFRRTLTAVRQNQERRATHGNLLRPADAPAASKLLRPAGGGSGGAADSLLRPTSKPASLLVGTKTEGQSVGNGDNTEGR
jgi:hypothetical protein